MQMARTNVAVFVIAALAMVACSGNDGEQTGDGGAGQMDGKGSISGQVVLEDMENLDDMSRVSITLGTLELVPDEDGKFSAEVDSGPYQVSVTYTGNLTSPVGNSAWRWPVRSCMNLRSYF